MIMSENNSIVAEGTVLPQLALKPAELVAQAKLLASEGKTEEALSCYEQAIRARTDEGKRPFKVWLDAREELRNGKNELVRVDYRPILDPAKFAGELEFLKGNEIHFDNRYQVGSTPKEVVTTILIGALIVLKGAIDFIRKGRKQAADLKEENPVPLGLKSLSDLLQSYAAAKKKKDRAMKRECEQALTRHLSTNLKLLVEARCPGSREAATRIAWINEQTAKGIAGTLLTLLLKEEVRGGVLRSVLNGLDAATSLKTGKTVFHVFPQLMEELQRAFGKQGFTFDVSPTYEERYNVLREMNSLEKGQSNFLRTRSLLEQAQALLSDSTQKKNLEGSSEVDQDELLREIQAYLEKVTESQA